jgi:hypothetical protein
MTERRGHGHADNPAILGAVALFSPEPAARLIEAIVTRHACEALAPSCGASRRSGARPSR